MAMPICDIISGGVNIAEKTKIPIIKYFLFSFRVFRLKILNLFKIINSIGNSKESPLVNNKYIVSFIYSEYFDSKTTGTELCIKFSNEIKKLHIIGIKK